MCGMSYFDCVVCLVFHFILCKQEKLKKINTRQLLEKLHEHLELNVNVYVNMIYESSDVTPETNYVIVLLTTIYFVRVINTVNETITCAKLGYIFTVVTLIHVK